MIEGDFMRNKDNLNEIIIAAMLHDIGKFAQRTKNETYNETQIKR